MKIEIRNLTGVVIFAHERNNNSLKTTVQVGIVQDADLSGADLSGADLIGAYLSGADLSGAYLRGADMRGADMSGADLSGADLRGADMRGADMSDVDLIRADLIGADMSGADLSGADLRSANLRGADLSRADLHRADLRGAKILDEILAINPASIIGLHWDVLITSENLKIGCQRHSHSKWMALSDEEISQMDSHALAFWAEYKAILIGLCEIQKKKSDDFHSKNGN